MSEPVSAAPIRTRPGRPYPRGATWSGDGVNFALFSEHATAVELCLFDLPNAGRAREQIGLRERTDLVWHGYVPDLGPEEDEAALVEVRRQRCEPFCGEAAGDVLDVVVEAPPLLDNDHAGERA